MKYYPLHIWLQPVDDFGVEVGEALQTFNLDLIHAQIGDHIINPRHVSEEPDAHLRGDWTVQEREFTEHKGEPQCGTPRNFTLYIRQR